MTDTSTHTPEQSSTPRNPKRRRIAIGIFLSILIILAGIAWINRGYMAKDRQLRRADKAFEEGRYVSAYKDYKALTVSDSSLWLRVGAQKALCCFYNFNVDAFIAELSQLEGRDLHDPELSKSLDAVADRMFIFLSLNNNGFLLQMDKIPHDSIVRRTQFLDQSLQEDPDNLMAVYHRSTIYFDEKNYNAALALLIPAMQQNPDHQGLSSVAMACYRELKAYDKAEFIAQTLFRQNKESLIAYTGLCRLALKRKQDQQGLNYARSAYQLDSSDASAIISMMLASHFNRLSPGRDYYLQKLAAMPSVSPRDLVYYQNLMAVETRWRED